MSTPLGHFLSSLYFSKPLKRETYSPAQKIGLYGGMAFFCMCPDMELVLSRVIGMSLSYRSFGHALIWLPLIGFIGGIYFNRLLSFPVLKGGILAMMGFAMHILIDALATTSGPMIFWPFLPYRLDVDLGIFPMTEPLFGGFLFNLIAVGFEVSLYGLGYMLIWGPKRFEIRLALFAAFIFVAMGCYRQSNAKKTLFKGAKSLQYMWYKKNVKKLSPLHFALFAEAKDPPPKY